MLTHVMGGLKILPEQRLDQDLIQGKSKDIDAIGLMTSAVDSLCPAAKSGPWPVFVGPSSQELFS